jgi:hypothetical protein
MVMPLALGVAPPSSLSGASFPAPEPEALTGDDWKKSGDCVEPDCSRVLRGVACDPRCEACEASDCSCSSGPSGAGLLNGGAPRALRRGVTEAEVRSERRFVGEDIVMAVYVATKSGYRGAAEGWSVAKVRIYASASRRRACPKVK